MKDRAARLLASRGVAMTHDPIGTLPMRRKKALREVVNRYVQQIVEHRRSRRGRRCPNRENHDLSHGYRWFDEGKRDGRRNALNGARARSTGRRTLPSFVIARACVGASDQRLSDAGRLTRAHDGDANGDGAQEMEGT